jgi:hypothetical protein
MDMARRQPYRRQISPIAPRFGPERLMLMAQIPLQRGTSVMTNMPRAARLLPRLLYQFVPAALVTVVGILLLDNLARVPDAPTIAAPVETAISTEAVFKIMPREPSADAEQDSRPAKATPPRAAVNAKPPAAGAPPSRKAASEPAAPPQVSSPPVPLQTVQVAVPPQPAEAAPEGENYVMSKLRSATTAVQQFPQKAARSVAGWFAAEAPPPRPPASVPEPDVRAAM